MPRYDYKCEANGHVFEVTQGFNDEPGAICPEDGSPADRQFTVPHVIYKGSGFYTTDYKNAGSNGGSSSSSKSSSESKKSEASSSESTSSSKSSDSTSPKSSSSSDSSTSTTTKAKSGSDSSKS